MRTASSNRTTKWTGANWKRPERPEAHGLAAKENNATAPVAPIDDDPPQSPHSTGNEHT